MVVPLFQPVLGVQDLGCTQTKVHQVRYYPTLWSKPEHTSYEAKGLKI